MQSTCSCQIIIETSAYQRVKYRLAPACNIVPLCSKYAPRHVERLVYGNTDLKVCGQLFAIWHPHPALAAGVWSVTSFASILRRIRPSTEDPAVPSVLAISSWCCCRSRLSYVFPLFREFEGHSVSSFRMLRRLFSRSRSHFVLF